jgi:hypothetical protein
MITPFLCPACGEHGWIISDEPTLACCLRCGRQLDTGPDRPRSDSKTAAPDEDVVVSWLLETAPPPEAEGCAGAKCVACGCDDLMPCDSPRGDTICMCCLEVFRTRPLAVKRLVECPNCAREIKILEADRGKTIICADCHYFLGCMLEPEKRQFRALPFLNTLVRFAQERSAAFSASAEPRDCSR